MAATRCKAPRARTSSTATTPTDRRAKQAQLLRPGWQRVSASRFSSCAARGSQSPVHRRENRADQNPRSRDRTGSGNAIPQRICQILTDGERGLLGLAFDPNFASNGFFYVYLINTSGDAEIRRYHVSANPNVADAASATPIITIEQPTASNHKARLARFRTRRLSLYRARRWRQRRRPFDSGQNINNLLGKILRIDVHGDGFPGDPARNYAVPADNPFVGRGRRRRNICVWPAQSVADSFDRAAGRLLHCRCRPGPMGRDRHRPDRRQLRLEHVRGSGILSGGRSAHRRVGGGADLLV